MQQHTTPGQAPRVFVGLLGALRGPGPIGGRGEGPRRGVGGSSSLQTCAGSGVVPGRKAQWGKTPSASVVFVHPLPACARRRVVGISGLRLRASGVVPWGASLWWQFPGHLLVAGLCGARVPVSALHPCQASPSCTSDVYFVLSSCCPSRGRGLVPWRAYGASKRARLMGSCQFSGGADALCTFVRPA